MLPISHSKYKKRTGNRLVQQAVLIPPTTGNDMRGGRPLS